MIVVYMAYYVVQIGNSKVKRVIQTDMHTNDIKRMYEQFIKRDVSVTPSKLPTKFFETISFKNHKYMYSNRTLELLFSTWCYFKGLETSKYYFTLLTAQAMNIVRTYIGYTPVLMNRQTMSVSDQSEIVADNMTDTCTFDFCHVSDIDNTESCIPRSQPSTPHLGSPKHVNEFDVDTHLPSDIVKLPKDICVKWSEGVEKALNEARNSFAKDIQEPNNIEKVISSLSPLAQTIINDTASCDRVINSMTNSSYESKFKRRKLQASPVFYKQCSKKVNDVVVNKGVLLVVYYNNDDKMHNIVLLDVNDMQFLEKFHELGMEEIQIKSVITLPKAPIVSDLLTHYDFDKCLTDVNTFTRKVYDVHTVLHNKPCKGVFIKCVMEFLYTHYSFTVDGVVEFESLVQDMRSFNNGLCTRMHINKIMDETFIRSILQYLCIPIKDNKVLHISKKSQVTPVHLGIDEKIIQLVNQHGLFPQPSQVLTPSYSPLQLC